MVQGYIQQDRGSKSVWASSFGSIRAEGGKPFPRTIFYSNEVFWCSHSRRVANDQWAAYLPEEPKLSRADVTDRETGGSMLSVTGINRFYYLRDFTKMRSKHNQELSIIREQPHHEPPDGDVFIVMSCDRRIVKIFTYDNRSYTLFEKTFVAAHQFLKVDHNGGERV